MSTQDVNSVRACKPSMGYDGQQRPSPWHSTAKDNIGRHPFLSRSRFSGAEEKMSDECIGANPGSTPVEDGRSDSEPWTAASQLHRNRDREQSHTSSSTPPLSARVSDDKEHETLFNALLQLSAGQSRELRELKDENARLHLDLENVTKERDEARWNEHIAKQNESKIKLVLKKLEDELRGVAFPEDFEDQEVTKMDGETSRLKTTAFVCSMPELQKLHQGGETTLKEDSNPECAALKMTLKFPRENTLVSGKLHERETSTKNKASSRPTPVLPLVADTRLKAGISKRQRRSAFSPEQRKAMKEFLKRDPDPSKADKRALARKLGLEGKSVATFFTNEKRKMGLFPRKNKVKAADTSNDQQNDIHKYSIGASSTSALSKPAQTVQRGPQPSMSNFIKPVSKRPFPRRGWVYSEDDSSSDDDADQQVTPDVPSPSQQPPHDEPFDDLEDIDDDASFRSNGGEWQYPDDDSDEEGSGHRGALEDSEDPAMKRLSKRPRLSDESTLVGADKLKNGEMSESYIAGHRGDD